MAKAAARAVARAEKLKKKVAAATTELQVKLAAVKKQAAIVKADAKSRAMRTRHRGRLSKSKKASEARIQAKRDALQLTWVAAIKSQSKTLSKDAKQATKEVKLVKRDAKHIRN